MRLKEKSAVDGNAAPALSRSKKIKRMLGQRPKFYAMVVPTYILLALFLFYPLGRMIYLSFFEYSMLKEPVFVGLDNFYKLLFVEEGFLSALKNTMVYMVGEVIFCVILALIFALWFQKSTFLNSIAQRLMFFPHVCSMLAIALIFQWLMDTEGLFNAVLGVFNLPGLRWLDSSSTAMIAILIVTVWKGSGYYALLLMSSLKSIPTELIEAAELDDAGKIRTFFKITLPMLSPQLFFVIIVITTGSVKVFESVRTLTGGGPGYATDVLVYYVYRMAFNYNKFGLACAGGVFLLLILIILTVIQFKVIGKKVHYQ